MLYMLLKLHTMVEPSQIQKVTPEQKFVSLTLKRSEVLSNNCSFGTGLQNSY